MVELVLSDPRGHVLEIESDLVPQLVTTLEPDGERPLDRHGDPLDREAAFIICVDLVPKDLDLRIDERRDLVFLRVEDEHPTEHADLRRREPDAVRILHQVLHAGNEPAKVVVELLHGRSRHAQHGIGVLADLRQRKLAPGFVLGVELAGANLSLYSNFSLYLVHLRHRSRCRRQDARALLARPSALTGRPT